MIPLSTTRRLVCLGAFTPVLFGFAQTSSDNSHDYTLTLPVDEVVLTFHAADTHGLPVNDIRLGEVKVLDNGLAPKNLVAFDALTDRPLRAAFLLDTSESMDRFLQSSRLVAERFAERIFRQSVDQGLVTQFGYSSAVVRSWTADPAAIASGIQAVRPGQANPLPGTALIDSVFRTCFHAFGTADSTATGNLILLFSDGEDTASHTTIEEALRACQRSNTAIYAFRVPSASGSPGPKTLADLARGTGGQVFAVDGSDASIWRDLRVIESEMRNQYRLVYRPAQLKHDGAFHSIELQLPDRVSRFEVRPGYFAPEH